MFLSTIEFLNNLTLETECCQISSGINAINNDNLSKTSSQSHTNEILIYCQNFNRMRSSLKIKQIHKNLLSSSFSVVLGTETSWDEGIKSEEVFGSDFNVFRDDRNLQLSQRKSGGGVVIAVSSKFNSELINSSKVKEFEHVWVKTCIAGETHVFASVYFPPDFANKTAYEVFFANADEILSQLPPEIKLHIYGDFNQRNADFIPDIDNEGILLPVVGDNETLQFVFDKIAIMGLNQINNVKNQQNCYLDLLLTNVNEDFCVNACVSPLWKNEAFHTAIEYSLFVHNIPRSNDYEYEEVFEYHKANYDNIKHKLNVVDWQSILKSEDNIENAVGTFYKILYEIIDKEVPTKMKRRHGNFKHPVWFNKNIINLRNRKQKAHKM